VILLAEQNQGKLELIALKTFKTNDEIYLLVDFLNKSLKEHNLIFGLTKDSTDQTMSIAIYET